MRLIWIALKMVSETRLESSSELVYDTSQVQQLANTSAAGEFLMRPLEDFKSSTSVATLTTSQTGL